ncbi:hypothetical protein CA831_09150 [Burkholderia multivorans]|nr:hypothetical protein CA831_09150 [Burkholderia multivorans]
MGETWMGLAIGGSALTVALTVAIALHWLERRRARRLRDFDHHDCWLVACATIRSTSAHTRFVCVRSSRPRSRDCLPKRRIAESPNRRIAAPTRAHHRGGFS